MFAGLSLDQAPPLKAPAKFFLTAPLIIILFSVVAAIIHLIPYRSDLITVAFFHTTTIGFMIFVIFGALLQMLPVVAGAVIPNVNVITNITYFSLILGLILFFMGFYLDVTALLYLSGCFISIGMLTFVITAIKELIKVKQKSYIVLGIFISLLFIFAGFMMGLFLLFSHASMSFSQIHYIFVTIHKNFIFFGGVFVLISAISFQVIPMFWVTPSYSSFEQRFILFGAVLALCFSFIDEILFQTLMSVVLLVYVATTTMKLRNRRRKIKDHTIEFWYLSLVFLVVGVLFWIFSVEKVAILFGAFAITLMSGMLYKIMPFLVWFHLSSKGIFDIPSMKEMIKSYMIELQKWTLVVSFCLFVMGFYEVGFVVFGISNFILFINLLKVMRLYILKA